MVQKNLIIILAFLWIIHHFMGNRTITSKFRKVQRIKYKQAGDIINNHHSCTALECDFVQTDKDGVIDITRCKRDIEIQYRHEKKEDIRGFIPKPVARPEYGTVYQHQSMLLQNLHHRYLYIVIQLPHVHNLHQKIPSFLHCDIYGIFRASNQD